ncbi:oligosaccharide flippase family protein [Desulfurivibrio alkaliphilus]|uniref:Polysaccharide biosynthesis protein n=1 Tax=Desulfurivibrio alkaliphilus (strain DSM 19089 / UNIQEM U267 / AHT2) TaxID=589865 RepID=D6Z4H1_DESAT|nr:oligosaccharide flippase family protein [Desulfurivibrio alkaliphilus]ADH86446.1 polysaccharide biosynthesis protein [Desulfurivibrio alkaliphilus AHT 2]
MSDPSVKARALSGSAWTIGGYGLSQGLRLFSHLILAWLLAPEIFGLMALVMVLMNGLQLFADFGIGPSIIQNKRGLDPAFLNTAWTIEIIRGFVLWIITCLLAVPFAWWYAQNDPAAWQISYLLPVAALVSVISGFNSPALHTLNKELRFARLTLIELGVQLISLVVMVGWAMVHPTPWAMIAGGLTGATCKMISSHLLIPGYRVHLGWCRQCFHELFKFGKWILLSTAFTFLASNLDKLVLGNLLTLAELGLYSIALVFAQVALQVASRLGSVVMFPVYSKFQDDKDRLMVVALRARKVVLLVGMAACVSIAVGAPLFFETLWDARYHGIGVIAQWLTIYIWMQILLFTMDRIPLALGNSRALFFSNVVRTCGVMPAMGGYWLAGLPGFIVGLALGPMAAHLFLVKYLPCQQSEMVRQGIRFTAIAGLVGMLAVGFTVWVRMMFSPTHWAVSVILSVGILLLVTSTIAYRRVWGEELRHGK